jgi:CBS domain-containing protein
MQGHARSIMTAPVTSVTPSTPLADIARILAAGRFGGVPVVEEDNRVVGFVSESDLMDALIEGRGPDARALELMSAPVVTVDEFDRTDEVMRVLRERGTHHLPVLRQGRLVGIITASDVIRYLVDRLLPEPPKAS